MLPLMYTLDSLQKVYLESGLPNLQMFKHQAR